MFASVITGNLVVLALSAARAEGRLARYAACAISGYALGVILAAPRRTKNDEDRPAWPESTTRALGAELALLITFAVVWEIDGRAPARGVQIAMLVLCAGAMGVQSTAVRRVGDASTTYLTSTLTGLLEAIVVRFGADQARSLGILLALACGAAAAAVLIGHAFAWLPALQLLPLAIVELVSLRLIRPRRGARTPA